MTTIVAATMHASPISLLFMAAFPRESVGETKKIINKIVAQ